MKYLNWALVVIFLLIGLSIGYFYQVSVINNMNARLITAQDENANLREENSNLLQSLNESQTQVNKLEVDKATLESELKSLRNQINNYTSWVSELKVKIVNRDIIIYNLSGPNPVITYDESWTYWQASKGCWSETFVTVENRGRGGNILVWAKVWTGNRIYTGETNIYLSENDIDTVQITITISNDRNDYDLKWYYECGARRA